MKKIICLFLMIAFLIAPVACAESGADDTGTTGSRPTESTVSSAPETKGSSETLPVTETTASAATETTEFEPFIFYLPENAIDPRDIVFEGFWDYIPGVPIEDQVADTMKYPLKGAYVKKLDVKGYFSGMKQYDFTEWDPVIVTITGYDPIQSEKTKSLGGFSYGLYLVDAVYYSGMMERQIAMLLMGHPDQPFYGRPTLFLGNRYLRLNTADLGLEHLEGLSATVLFLIEERDGVEYVYGHSADLSHMDCAIPITDPYENAVYKPGVDDDIIAYMEANGITAPTYDYKCELSAFIKEMNDDIS